MDRFDAAVQELGLRLPTPLVEVSAPMLTEHSVSLWLKRDDLLHPDIPGNKWRKLCNNLRLANEQRASRLLTFGGAYSNHIRAVAVAAQHFELDAIGIIRGEQHEPLNEVLNFAQGCGMQLKYMNRDTYRRKHTPEVIANLREEFGEFFLIPEGGSNTEAVRGCLDVVKEIAIDFDYLCCPCGTGGTLAGIAAALTGNEQAIGFSALKGGNFLTKDVTSFQQATFGEATSNWRVETRYHFGGFAKHTNTVRAFIDNFEHDFKFRPEWVYVAKMLFGIWNMIDNGEFAPESKVVALITG